MGRDVDGLSFEVAEFLDDGLAWAVDFEVEGGVFVGSGEVGDDPSELVGVEFLGGKLCDLVESVGVAPKDLNTKTVSPIRAAISRICSNNVVSIIIWFFPYFEGCELRV